MTSDSSNVAQHVERRCDNALSLPVLETVEVMEPFHDGGARSAVACNDVLQVRHQHARRGSYLAILDDVLTTGAHFEGARRRLLEAYPDHQIIGICWAKAERLEE